ncbi:MAG: hypothetical protein HDT24_00550 [Ruminococcus sp.]|nr:hypothetical protein [Ruminococcus sp.]
MSKAKKIIIRVLLIIFVIISILSIIFTVITIANRTPAEDVCEVENFDEDIYDELYNLLFSGENAYSVGVNSENGRDVLRINSPVDSNYGYNSLLFLGDDGVVSAEHYGGSHIDLTAQKSGHCGVVIERYWAIDLIDVCIYDITVDENLKISYNDRSVDKFTFYNHDSVSYGEITVQANDNSVVLSDNTAQKLRDEINSIYGGESYCRPAPDLSECVKIVCVKKEGYIDGTDTVCEFYVSKDRLYYCNIIAGDEKWLEFTPDEFCSLDRINELLDLKD